MNLRPPEEPKLQDVQPAAPTSLPTAPQVDEALSALEQIWNKVPRSDRPHVKGDLDDVRRVLERVLRYAKNRAKGAAIMASEMTGKLVPVQSAEEAEMAGENEEGEDMSEELIAKIEEILTILASMSAPERAATAEAIDSEFCTGCWEELPEEDSGEPPHVCAAEVGESEEGT